MFYKTINEWKQYIKPINEGGGAGISFKTDVFINIRGFITKDKIEITDKDIRCESFNAEGYEVGMSNIDPKIIVWEIPEITKEMILNIKLVDNDDAEYTMENQLNLEDTKQIDFEFECTYTYDNMHFGGWLRGKLKEGDVIFNQKLNYNSNYDFNDETISLTRIDKDGSQNILDEDYINNEIFIDIAPIGKAGEEFEYFYNDVFEYSAIDDAKSLAYSEVIGNDKYDDDIQQYIDDNGIDITLEEYKKQLISDDNELPNELFTFLDNQTDITDFANDMHWDDVKTNWGI